MKNTARNKQIVFFSESTSRKTVKLKLFLEKAKKREFLDIILVKVLIEAFHF